MIKKHFYEQHGAKEYNRFLGALFGPAKEKKRLMTWQNSIWLTFLEKVPEYPKDFQGIIEAFQNDADRIEISDNEFIGNPFDFFGRPDFTVSGTALRGAYSRNDFRDHILYTISRSVSKTGDFNLCSFEVAQIKEIITDDEKKDLFSYIVENSGRSPEEWSSAFHRLFNL